MASLLKSITAWAAGYRNLRHSENVRLGKVRKRARVEATGEPYQHGRRPINQAIATRVHELQNLSRRQIAAAAGVSASTAQNYLAASNS